MRRSQHGFEALETCATCAWRTDRYFCAISSPALEVFDRIAFTNVYPAGSVLFSEGETSRAIYMMCKGSAKLSVASHDGKTLITHIAHGGEVLGLASAITGHESRTTAETLEPSQVKIVRREDFIRFLAEHADVSRQTSRQLADECEAWNDDVRSIGLSHSAAEKLAHLLLTWCDDNGHETPDGTRVQVLMTHHDISQLIGTSRETVTRLLRAFREKNLISIKGSTLLVRNRSALEALVSLS